MVGALIRSELALRHRSRMRWVLLVAGGLAFGIVLVAFYGEHGDPERLIDPLYSTFVIGAPRSVAGVLIPVAAVVLSISATFRGAAASEAADANLIYLPGPVRGPWTAAAVAGVSAGVLTSAVIVSTWLAVVVGRLIGGIDAPDQLPNWTALVRTSATLVVLIVLVTVGWVSGWSSRMAPGSGVAAWVGVVLVVPSVIAAALTAPPGETVGAVVEYVQRGGPLMCGLSGVWPSWVDTSDQLLALSAGVVLLAAWTVGSWLFDRVVCPVPAKF